MFRICSFSFAPLLLICMSTLLVHFTLFCLPCCVFGGLSSSSIREGLLPLLNFIILPFFYLVHKMFKPWVFILFLRVLLTTLWEHLAPPTPPGNLSRGGKWWALSRENLLFFGRQIMCHAVIGPYYCCAAARCIDHCSQDDVGSGPCLRI